MFLELFWEPRFHRTGPSLSLQSFLSTGKRQMINTSVPDESGVKCSREMGSQMRGLEKAKWGGGQLQKPPSFGNNGVELEGNERRRSVCILSKTIPCTGKSHHEGFVTRACWVSEKSKEARWLQRGREGEETAVDRMREARGPKEVSHCQDLDSCSE